MSDQNVTTTEQVSPAPPATQGEHMIPKSRFDEINTERQKLADRLAQIETERQTETEKRLASVNLVF